MSTNPKPVAAVLEEFALVDDRELRSELLIEAADRFTGVPEELAKRPYPKSHLVPGCESEAYVWGEKLENGALKYYFAVENPQGVSAKAMAVILDESLSGLPLKEVLRIDSDIVYQIFGRGIAMGKGQGLMGMLFAAQALARRAIEQESAEQR